MTSHKFEELLIKAITAYLYIYEDSIHTLCKETIDFKMFGECQIYYFVWKLFFHARVKNNPLLVYFVIILLLYCIFSKEHNFAADTMQRNKSCYAPPNCPRTFASTNLNCPICSVGINKIFFFLKLNGIALSSLENEVWLFNWDYKAVMLWQIFGCAIYLPWVETSQLKLTAMK